MDQPARVGDRDLCVNCDQSIYGDKWGAWRHYDTGLLLCQPDEDAPDFTGVECAEPAGFVDLS